MTTFAGLTLVAASAGVPRGIAGAAIAAGLAGSTIYLLWLLRPLVRRTTLVSAWLWSLSAVVGLGLLEVVFQLQPPGQVAPWLSAATFAAAVLTLCPMVAVLGAKRPQDRAWNFVVLALWGIVSLPSLLSLTLGRGVEFQLTDLRGLILWVLIALPAINFVPTRNAWGALLAVLGEMILFAPHLPLIGRPILATDPGLVSLACFGAAACVALRTVSARPPARHSFDLVWLAFRDVFGLFWALRVQERVNAAAQQYGWPFYLSWSGFHRADNHQPLDDVPAEYARGLRQTLTGLLRRFASADWIATWLRAGID